MSFFTGFTIKGFEWIILGVVVVVIMACIAFLSEYALHNRLLASGATQRTDSTTQERGLTHWCVVTEALNPGWRCAP
jgi:hypothetical protein